MTLNFAGLDGKETTHNTSSATFYKGAKPGDEAEMRCFPSGNSSFVRQGLRTFAPIVSAHPYCARNSLRDVMPRHVLSARAVEEMWRYIALVGTLISMHGFNSLKCSVTHIFF